MQLLKAQRAWLVVVLVGCVAVGVLVIGAGSVALAGLPASVVATPSERLVNGQSIQVAGSGFPDGATVYVIECSKSAPSPSDCDVSNVEPAFVASDGTFSLYSFTVHTGVIGDGKCNASSSCVLLATSDPTGADPTQVAVTPISFVPSRPTTTEAASSRSSVDQGERFTVSGKVTSKGEGIPGIRVALYAKRGMKYDRVGSKAVLVDRARTGNGGRFSFRVRGSSVVMHEIVESAPAAYPDGSYDSSVSKVLTIR